MSDKGQFIRPASIIDLKIQLDVPRTLSRTPYQYKRFLIIYFLISFISLAYVGDGNANATNIIAELSTRPNSNDKPLGNIRATDSNAKSISIDSNSAHNAAESNHERNVEAGMDITTELSRYI